MICVHVFALVEFSISIWYVHIWSRCIFGAEPAPCWKPTGVPTAVPIRWSTLVNSWLELEGCGNLKPHMDYDSIYKFQLNIYKFSERFWQVVTLPQNMFLHRYFRYKISPWNCSGFAGASAWSMAVVNHDAWLMGDIHDVLKCYPVAAHNLVVFWSFTEAQTTNTAIWLYMHIYILLICMYIYLTYACILYTFVTFVYVHV